MNKVLALSLCVLAASCTSHNTSHQKSIEIHGNTMRVKVKSVIDGHKIYDYDNTFDATGLNQEQRDSILQHVSDSIELVHNKK